MSLDLAAKARLVGRLYGRMVKPLALRAVDAVAQCVQAPIIASGGIHTVEDALEFLALGASAVQVGSATWVEPGTMLRIVKDIAAGQQTERIDDVASRH